MLRMHYNTVVTVDLLPLYPSSSYTTAFVRFLSDQKETIIVPPTTTAPEPTTTTPEPTTTTITTPTPTTASTTTPPPPTTKARPVVHKVREAGE